MTEQHSHAAPVGNYEVIEDHEWPQLSIRILRLLPGAPIEPHVHYRSSQIYVALQGSPTIAVDGIEEALQPFGARAVWPGSTHTATSTAESILMNISVPPLREDDQVRIELGAAPDLALPHEGSDVED